MKKILLFILMFFLSVSNVYANSIEDSLNSISTKIKQIKEKDVDVTSKISKRYPVGSIYMSLSSTDPSTIFGGTWEAFATGRTLLGVSTDEDAGSTGGASSVTLVSNNLPSHTHTYTASGTITSTFTGSTTSVVSNSASHTHTFNAKISGDEATGYGVVTSGGFGGRVLISGMSTSKSTASASDSHYHTVTASGTVKSTFSGTKADSSSVGSGTAFSVLNSYVTVYIWKRIA